MRLSRILEELKYRLLDGQKIRISVGRGLGPHQSKNEVFKFRSVSSIVIAPARTGRDRRRRIAVIRIDQTNNGILSRDIDF